MASLLLLVACGAPTDGAAQGSAIDRAEAEAVDEDTTDQHPDEDTSDGHPDDDTAGANDLAAEQGPAGEADPGAPDAAPGTSDADPGAPDPTAALEVHYLDVGQADATLLLHDEVTVLIDAGHWQRSDVVPALRSAGVEALDLVVVTHPHADHLGQFDQVLDAFDVAEVWWSGSTTTTRTFERALAAVERSDAAYEEPRGGATTTLGPLTIDIVNPPRGVGLADLHDAGLGLRVSYGEVSLLFTGDAETATEARMVRAAAGSLAADILQLGHHGSSTSTTPGFLAAVDPAVAIYSAGSGNSYGHPHTEVIDRVAGAGIDLYGTDVHGTVVLTTDGSSWEVSTDHTGTPTAGSSSGGGTSDGGPDSTSSDGDDGTDTASDDADTSEEPTSPSGDCGPGQVDINSAGSEDLQLIIHIGPDRAQQIPPLRPFSSVSAMDRISGIGPARVADIIDEGIACAG